MPLRLKRSPENPLLRKLQRKQKNKNDEEAGALTDSAAMLRKLQHDRRMSRLSVLSLMAAFLLLIAAAAVAMQRAGMLRLPLLPWTSSAPSDGSPDQEDALLALLDEARADTAVTAVISDEEYLDLLAAAPPVLTYRVEMSTTMYSDSGSLSRFHVLTRDGDRYRIDTSRSAGSPLLSSILCDGATVRVTDYTGPSPVARDYPVSPVFTPENQIGIPSLTDFLTRADAEHSGIAVYRAGDSNLIRASFRLHDLPQTETLYISPEQRMILSAETVSDDGATLFRLVVSSFTNDIGDASFILQ